MWKIFHNSREYVEDFHDSREFVEGISTIAGNMWKIHDSREYVEGIFHNSRDLVEGSNRGRKFVPYWEQVSGVCCGKFRTSFRKRSVKNKPPFSAEHKWEQIFVNEAFEKTRRKHVSITR